VRAGCREERDGIFGAGDKKVLVGGGGRVYNARSRFATAPSDIPAAQEIFMTTRLTRICLGLLLAAAASVALPRQASAQWYLLESLAYANKCMDNAGGNLSDGNPLVSYPCQYSVNQYFQRLSDGHVVVQKGQVGPRGYQMCMDYYPTRGAIGDPVRIWPCHPISSPSDTQHWYYLNSGQWLGASGNCVAASSSANAAQLVMAACNPSNPPINTRWKVR
jgi:hypothetical protein